MGSDRLGTGVKRGEVWLTNFDPALGAEMRKIRPAVILQNNEGNATSPLTIVAPITTKHLERIYSFQTELKSLKLPSKVLLNQLRAIDKKRLLKRIGAVTKEEQERIDEALKVSLGMY